MSKLGKATLLLGAAAIAAGVLFKRDKVAGLLTSRSQNGGQDTGWAPAPAPAPSNYDASGPVANTATPVPAPEPQVRPDEGGIDEQAEEAAAAAEAANIGGAAPEYADVVDESLPVASEANRPLAEAGEGSSEGQEQAEAALADAVASTEPGRSDYERQIEDTIDQAANPFAGEQVEPVTPVDDAQPEGATTPVEGPSEPVAQAPAPEAPAAPQPVAETPAVPEPVAETPAVPEPVAEAPVPEPVEAPAEPLFEPAAETPAPEPVEAPAEPLFEPAAETPAVPATEPAPSEPVADTPEPVPAEPTIAPDPVADAMPPAEPADQASPGGEVPFGEGTTAEAAPPAETPGVPATEPAAEQVTPATTSWQPPAPPEPPAPSSPEAAQEPQGEQPLPQEEPEGDDSNDWKTWSGRAIRP